LQPEKPLVSGGELTPEAQAQVESIIQSEKSKVASEPFIELMKYYLPV